MPTYDYRCAACGHELETFQSINEPALRKCPRCGKSKLERLIGSGAGFLFKGGGFYQTDYRSESYKRGQSSDKDGGEAAPASGKPDAAKPAAEPAKTPSPEAAKPVQPAKPTPKKPARD